MFTCNFENYSADYDIFGAICCIFRPKVTRNGWNRRRKTNEIEKYIIEELKGTSFENLEKIAEFYKLNIEIFYKKIQIQKYDTSSNVTLRITTASKDCLKNIKVVDDIQELNFRAKGVEKEEIYLYIFEQFGKKVEQITGSMEEIARKLMLLSQELKISIIVSTKYNSLEKKSTLEYIARTYYSEECLNRVRNI